MQFFKIKKLVKYSDNIGLIAWHRSLILSFLLFCFAFSFLPEALAKVVHCRDAKVIGLPHSHVNLWRDDKSSPKGVVIAMHGLVMHGGVYDTLARRLVEEGYIVYAADMRGYGRWNPTVVSEFLASKKDLDEYSISDLGVKLYAGAGNAQFWHARDAISQKRTESQESKKFLQDHSKIVYSESFKDLLNLTRKVKSNHQNLPLFLVGESMGAGMALHVASEAPDCVDGLVLSSPAIKKKLNLAPRMIVDILKVVRHPKSPLDLKPYILRFSSEDPVIARCCANDPLVRKSLSLPELFRTAKEINRNIKYADKVPSNIPVLVIQGDKDRMVKSNGAALLLSHLNSKEQTVKWFGGKGHILLETPHVTEEAMNVVEQWLNQHYIESLNKVSVTALPAAHLD